MNDIGFGDSNFTFAVYIANRPKMFEYEQLVDIQPFSFGEIEAVNQCCGNGWRKVFNVYAKILYALESKKYDFSKMAPSWQDYREQYLLQQNSRTALLFSAPNLTFNLGRSNRGVVHIIAGKTYAKELIRSGALVDNLTWLNNEFAIDKKHNLIVCPYLDYRQLSNLKIVYLSGLLSELTTE